MPKVLLALPETEESVLRPVVTDILASIAAITRIPEDTKILYPSEILNAKQQGSSLDDPKLTGAKFPFAGQMHVEVDEQYDEATSIATAVMRNENYYIFRDDDLEIAMRPVYVFDNLTLNIRYRAVDKNTAVRWRDEIRARASMDRSAIMLNVKYYYPIPNAFIAVMYHLYQLREAQYGYGQDFQGWLRGNATPRLTWITNQSGEQGIWAVTETLTRVMGYFDFTAEPEQGSKEDEASTWTINVAFHVNCDMPKAAVLMYPLMIHNQLVGKDFRPSLEDRPEFYYEYQAKSYGLSNDNLRHFEAGMSQDTMNATYGLSIPAFDEFIPSSVLPKTLRLFTVMLSLDPNNPRALMNYDDLKQITLDADVKAFLLTEYPYVTQPYKSIFNLSLYEGKNLKPGNTIAVDAAGNVSLTIDPNFRKYYHLRLSLVTDLALLDPDAIERIREHGAAAQKILEAIYPALAQNGKLPSLLGNGSISNKDLSKIVDGQITISGAPYHFNTVMFLTIEPHRESEL